MRGIRIKELFPRVECIVIEYQITYISAFGKMTKSGRAEYDPDFEADFSFGCINDSCTGKGFDLYSEVSMMAAKGETERSGCIWCDGNESRKHRTTCHTSFTYSVYLEYQKGSPR